MKKQRWIAGLLILTLLAGLLCGCSKNAATEEAQRYEYTADMDYGYMAPQTSTDDKADSAGGTAAALPANRKLIRTVYMDAESENMDALLPSLEQKLTELGGYIEKREIYNNSNSSSQWRNASLTLRVPSDKADTFLTQLEETSNVTSIRESLDDVTLAYVDTESRILALETERDRLLELLEKAESLTDLLEIEARLTEVRYELENHASQLRVYDNLIDYTTIHLSLRQVTQLTPTQEQTVWQRIGTGFSDTLKGLGETLTDIFVWLIVASPVLVVLAIPVTAVILLIRARRKKKAAKAVKSEPDIPAE